MKRAGGRAPCTASQTVLPRVRQSSAAEGWPSGPTTRTGADAQSVLVFLSGARPGGALEMVVWSSPGPARCRYLSCCFCPLILSDAAAGPRRWERGEM